MSESDNIPFTDLDTLDNDEPAEEEALVPLEAWQWTDFRDAWEELAKTEDADFAWRVLFTLWQLRAGEIETMGKE